MNQEPNDPANGPSEAAERHQRAAARHACYLHADGRVQDPATGKWLTAGLRDLSSWGVSLLLPDRFEVGQVLTVHLQRRDRDFSRTVNVRVRHAEILAPNDAWLHGCEFAEALDEDDVRALL